MAEKEAQCKAFTRLFYRTEKPVPLGGHLHLVQRLAVVVCFAIFNEVPLCHDLQFQFQFLGHVINNCTLIFIHLAGSSSEATLYNQINLFITSTNKVIMHCCSHCNRKCQHNSSHFELLISISSLYVTVRNKEWNE